MTPLKIDSIGVLYTLPSRHNDPRPHRDAFILLYSAIFSHAHSLRPEPHFPCCVDFARFETEIGARWSFGPKKKNSLSF